MSDFAGVHKLCARLTSAYESLGNGQTYASGDQNLAPQRVKGLEDVHIHDISCGSKTHFATGGEL